MGLEKILEKIDEDARAEANRVILETRQKADKIKEEAKREASEFVQAFFEEVKRAANLEASRIITQARLERRINLLQCKRDLIERVLEEALNREIFDKSGVKRKIILKEGEREKPFDQKRLKEEMRLRLENSIIEVLKI